MNTATKEAPALSELYERDEVAWYGAMIELIELGRTEEVDFVNLKELLESMANREHREVKSRLRILLAHWLKWEYQPEQRTGSWVATLLTQRFELMEELSASRVLYNYAAEIIDEVYPRAVKLAATETGLPADTFPAICPVTLDELLVE